MSSRRRDRIGSGPGGLAPDVDDVGAVPNQVFGMIDGRVTGQEAAAETLDHGRRAPGVLGILLWVRHLYPGDHIGSHSTLSY